MRIKNPLAKTINTTIEVSVRLVIFFILTAWCLMIILPFITPLIWGIILAVSVAPIYYRFDKKIKNRKLTAVIIAVLMIILLLIPGFLFLSSIVRGIHDLGISLRDGTMDIPPPDETVTHWPVIGPIITDAWNGVHGDMMEALQKYSMHLTSIGLWLLRAVKNVGLSLLYFFIAIVLSVVLLATKGAEAVSSLFFNKMLGDRGEEFKRLTIQTTRQVTRGILGVALIQATYLGVIFVLAGIPHAGIWALMCFVFAAIQLGPFPVVIPAIIYLFTTRDTTPAVLWGIFLFSGTLIDNILKPILLGKGAPVPMMVIFIGALGGFLFSGFIGLFTGAIVFSIGYTIFRAWLFEGISEDEQEKILSE